MGKLIDLTGHRFGRLIVIKQTSKTKRGQSRWLCQCNCDLEKKIIVLGYNLKNGHTQSCGCLQKEKLTERSTKHGYSGNNKTYRSWDGMIQRCTNPNNKKYPIYGGRGITICKRWRNSFEDFLKDMGEHPSPGYSLERINNDKGYYKKNCRWATPKEQARNRRNNHLVTCFGKLQCIAAWSEETGISKNTILWRLNNGWSPEKALTTPVKNTRRKINV